ncbi:MAG: hypothetical protein M3081_07325 [Gemmatimonadota bacterium]|nr:hypothetical protein [Gemmatimonadota bacterium]
MTRGGLTRIVAAGIAFVTGACEGGLSDGSPQSHISPDSAVIERVRQQYSSIERESPRYRQVERTLIGYATNGGGMVAFFADTTLRKIEALFLARSSQTTQTMYYWNGALVFVHREIARFDRPGSGIVASTGKELFFFSNGKLVRSVGDDGLLRPVDDALARSQTEELQRMARSLAEVARTPKRP